MKRLLLIAILLPVAAKADPRIAMRAYQASTVVVLRGKPGIETTIAFAADERIENIAVGNSATWQVTPNKRANLLFVKPVGAKAHTNMTVVTDQRTYLFDLVSTPGIAPVYMLRFSYPDAPAPVIAAAAITPVPAAEPAPAVQKETAALPAADRRFAWRSKGDAALLPRHVFDDGSTTFLSWDASAVLPAILTRDARGQEGPINFTVREGYILVDGVPDQLILRSGKQLATLTPAARPRPEALAASGNAGLLP